MDPYRGCALLELCRRIHLKEQQRAKEDKKQQALVKLMSEGRPITLKTINEIQPLSKEDVAPGGKFRFAPVIVNSNRERHEICRQKARLWKKITIPVSSSGSLDRVFM